MKISRRTVLRALATGAATGAAGSTALARTRKAKQRPDAPAVTEGPSILFVTMDDLNDFPSPTNGYPGIVTPNFDRLAAMGASFTTAMTPVPICMPARAAMMSGVVPWKSGVYSNPDSHLHGNYPLDHRFFPGYIRDTGGFVKYCGKLYHGFGKYLPPNDYDEYYFPNDVKASRGDKGFFRSLYEQYYQKDKSFDFGPGEFGGVFDSTLADWTAAEISDGFLNAPGNMLGCGFYRPHLPHVVPPEFFELYDVNPENPPGFFGASCLDNDLDLSDEPEKVAEVHDYIARLNEFGEYKGYLRGYLASVSFVDYQLGKLLDAYFEAGLSEHCYIVVTSDHGYHLCEKMHYKKSSLWERSLRVPLLIAGPGITPGDVIDDPVSLVDLYPTICSLMGLETPYWCDGNDLTPRLLQGAALPDDPVVSVWRDIPSGVFYRRARNRHGAYTIYGGGPRSGYMHDDSDPRFSADPHEWRNVASAMDRSLRNELKAALPSAKVFAKPVGRPS